MKKVFLATVLIAMSLTLLAQEFGCLEGDCEEGNGTYLWKDGMIYSGDWKKGARHGQGECYYVDGSSYIGEWNEDKCSGQGTSYATDGTIFVGEFKDGRRYKGRADYGDGEVYIGTFIDGHMNDKAGQYKFLNGNTYIGPIKNSILKGPGVMVMANGDRYEGECTYGEINGKGTMVKVDGKIKSGVWKDGFLFKKDELDNCSGTDEQVKEDFKNAKRKSREDIKAERDAKEKERLAHICDKCAGYGQIYTLGVEVVNEFGRVVNHKSGGKKTCPVCSGTGKK